MEIKSSEDAIDIKWLDGVKMEESHSMDNDQGGVNGHTWKIILHHMKMEVGYSCGQQHGDRLKCARQMYICMSFHFTGHWCVEMCMLGSRIDSHTNKKDFCCL